MNVGGKGGWALCKKVTIDSSSGGIAREPLLVRKNFISNINLGHLSYLTSTKGMLR